MAARRLIVVLVILLVISAIAAAIASNRQARFGASSTTTDTTSPGEARTPEPRGELVTAELRASPVKPPTVRAAVGDRLQLSVASERGRQVEIPPLGLIATAGSLSPAHFDLLLNEPGALPIVDATSEEVIGRIVVKPAGDASEAGGGGPGGKPREPAPPGRGQA